MDKDFQFTQDVSEGNSLGYWRFAISQLNEAFLRI